MKNLKVITGILALAFAILTVTSCRDNKKEQIINEDANQVETSETVMTYACPMKCEGDKTYDKEGKCPKCGMNLKEMKTGDDHSGHKH